MDKNAYFREFFREMQLDRLARYQVLNQYAIKGCILFTGSSLMEQFPINELLMNNGMTEVIYNRGVAGFTTDDMMQHMDEMVFGIEPSRIFINIGTNDIALPDYRQEVLMEKYSRIIRMIRERLPEAEVNMIAYYPVNETDKILSDEERRELFSTRNNINIEKANAAVKQMAYELNCRYIDVSDGLRDDNGRLISEYTIEGIHMYANGYQVILDNLKKYLMPLI